MEGNFRSLLRKFCLESTILGLKYFYLYPDCISRCFWLANMIGVLSLACLLTVLLYNRFAEMPTRFTIENQHEPINNFPYPSITLCSPNQITRSFMTHFNRTLVDGNLTIDLENFFPKLTGFYENLNLPDVNDMIQMQSLLDLNRYTVPEVMAATPQTCESFLKLCYLNNVKYLNCATLFQPILTINGLCCTFNNIYHYRDKKNVRDRFFIPKNVTKGGFNFGLTVVTDYNPDDAVDNSILYSGATKVMYTDFSEFPSNDESSLLETNVETYNTIHATYTYLSEDVRALPVWSRKCYLEDEHRLPYFWNYHNSDCEQSCLATAIQNACHCTLLYMPNLRAEHTCNITSLHCIVSTRARMAEWLPHCDCPRDCEFRQYKVSLSIGNLDAMQHMIYNPYADVKFKKSTTIMHFFFLNPVYVKQKQETVMSLISLASNLGGVFGLCLGCSGISVLEIMFYIYIFVKNYVKRKIRRVRVENID